MVPSIRNIIICLLKVITDYWLGLWSSPAAYVLSILLGSCAVVSVCGVSIRDSADMMIQHTFSQMVWQPPFVATFRCCPRLKRSEGRKGR